jgi:hypothetical protein
MQTTENGYLLMIEPKRPASAEPVNDWVTAKVRKLLKQAKREHPTRGVHVCVCGECSDNCDWILPDGTVTNSLAAHYVERHREEVPESEIHKLVKLMGVKSPNEPSSAAGWGEERQL